MGPPFGTDGLPARALQLWSDIMKTTIALFAALSTACVVESAPLDEARPPVAVDAAAELSYVSGDGQADVGVTRDGARLDQAVAVDSGAYRPEQEASTDRASDGGAADVLLSIDSSTTCSGNFEACVIIDAQSDAAVVADVAIADHAVAADSGARPSEDASHGGGTEGGGSDASRTIESSTTCTGNYTTCTTPDGEAGVAQCTEGKVVGACGLVGSCRPGDVGSETTVGITCAIPCVIKVDTWLFDYSECWTPLVLAFAGESVDFTHARGYFDLAGTSARVQTDWVSAQTPWLALDCNGNGRIDDGAELFGSMTSLADGSRARDGFAALAALDDDGDGRITAHDSVFGELLVWRDLNQDRVSSPDELTSAIAAGLVSIDLGYRVVPRCVDGDCEMERAHFEFTNAHGGIQEGDVIDVHLAGREGLARELSSTP